VKQLAIVIWLALAPLTLSAQNVLVVDDDGGPGVDYTNLHDAIENAPDGGIVLVKNGVYSSALIDGKSLTLTAEVTGAVLIDDGITVQNLLPEDVVTIREVGLAGIAPIHAIDNMGFLWIESCLLTADREATVGALTAVNSNNIVIRHTAIVGRPESFGHGIKATNSRLFLHDVDVIGGDGGNYNLAGHGAVLEDSFLFARLSSFSGGYGGESVCLHPTNGLPGGDAIVLQGTSGSELRYDRSTFEGGAGGPSPCGIGFPGPGGQDMDTINGTVLSQSLSGRSMTVSTPVRTDETAFITFSGQPDDLVFLLYGETPLALAIADPFNWLHVGAPSQNLFVALLDSLGSTSLNLSPSLPPGLLGRQLFVQALFLELGTMTPHFGLPTSVVILDESL